MGESKNTLEGLLCPETLRMALRSARVADIPAREGLKELLSPSAQPQAASFPPPQEHEFSRWERCLELLVEGFLSRRQDLLKLNKARRSLIENFIRSHSKNDVTLEEAVHSRMGSPEQEALHLFAHQAGVFHLLQVILLKRWMDRGLLPEDSLRLGEQTLNWQITGFLRKNSPKGMMARHDWSFLKVNIFSWFSPSPETWERLRLLLEPVNLEGEGSDFPARLLSSLGARSRLSLLGFNPVLIDSGALWRLVLEQKAFDLRLESAASLDFSSEGSGPVLVSGLRNGESLNALRELSLRKELHGAWAFTDSEFERYLSEMFILWDCASEIPRINIHPRSVLRDLSRDAAKLASLFHDGMRMPYQAQFGACFQNGNGQELEDIPFLLDQLKENGLLLVSSDLFWPTEEIESCDRLRDAILRKSLVRLIVDLRQLTGASGENLPKGVFLLEKCSSKELRDSHRPQMIRMRGHLQKRHVAQVWSSLLEHIRLESSPGEVNVRSLSAMGDSVRLESMAAAASQQELRSTPWITLSDPAFYEASGRLRRNPSRAYTFGTILRWKQGMPESPQRSILLQEQPKGLLAAQPGQEEPLTPDQARYLLIPEATVVEKPAFFISQIYSAPIQFWYRLEMEQNSGKKARPMERQSEQRLKMMPLVRLFQPGTLLPLQATEGYFPSLEEVRQQLNGIFRQSNLGMGERSRLHQIVLSLESSVRQNLDVCADFSRHLFPSLTINRASLPSGLPEISPSLALEIFRHLDRSQLLHHPAIHLTRLRPVHDFKVTSIAFEELPMGAMAELKIIQGLDPIIKLSGPALLIRAAREEFQQKLGRPFRETADRILFPTDFLLVETQLKEVVKTIERQLQQTREHLAILDQVFCCLLGLSTSFVDETVRTAMRRHLSPDDGKIHVRFQRESVFRPTGLGAPTGILQ